MPEGRKVDLRVALEEVLRAAGAAGGDPYDGTFSWPLMLVDAALKSESAGDAAAQDRLIEAIGVLLGCGVEESLSIIDAAERLSVEEERDQMRALIEEIAIPTLLAHEERFDSDDQARLNLEAGIGRTSDARQEID